MDPVVLIFAAVAAFVLFRLFSVLGTRTGHERRDVESVRGRAGGGEARGEAPAAPAAVKPLAPVSAPAEPLRAADPYFDEKAFLDGARAAYEMIVEAFAAGDLKSIRRYLDPSVYNAFKAAVAEREEKGHSTDLKFVGVDSARIVESSFARGVMTAVVDFASNQVRVTRDADGRVVEGDPTRIDLVKDRWTFSRKAASSDPNWTLVATGGAV